ncbi:MAG: S-layer homology domain-containing protein [Deltaproteobacteria bacterium]|nr:S-layer homology domain-containing protein [Deltaproteobacteria bacterium]
MRRRLIMLVPLLGLLLMFYGCAKPAPKCVAPEDNPQHHYLRGMELFEKNKIADAAAKFDRALYCEEGYSPAHSGLAMVEAVKAVGEKNEGYRKVDYDRAFERLKSAYKSAQTPEDEFAYRVASMRVHTVLKPKKWLSDVESDYSKAMKLKTDDRKLIYYDGKEAATYFMGIAYLDGREFQKARDSFGAVLGARREGKWSEPADRGWKKTDKIVRAIGGITLGDVGKEIAVKDSVMRGDMAALLVDEVKIEKLFAGRIPVKSAVDKMKPEFTPADVLNSQFKEEALAMMKWGVRGLEPSYDNTTKAYLFRPDAPVSRKEFALVLEDVLIKLTGDEAMASAFLGHGKSPFPDVQPTSAWYNAIMNVTTRNLMETELSGEFRPDDTVDGAEALLAIRVLRQRLNIY